jgi:hypothetical protein
MGFWLGVFGVFLTLCTFDARPIALCSPGYPAAPEGGWLPHSKANPKLSIA